MDEIMDNLPLEVAEAIAGGASVEEAMALLPEDQRPAATEEPPTPEAPRAEPEPTPEPPEGDQDPEQSPHLAEEDDEEDSEPDERPAARKKTRIRLNHLSQDDQDLMRRVNDAVQAGVFPDVATAFRAIAGTGQAEPAATQQEEGASSPPDQPQQEDPSDDPRIEAIDEQILAAKQAVAQARQDADDEAEADAMDRVVELRIERAEALREIKEQRTQQEQFRRQYAETWDALQDEHPDLEDESTTLYRLVDAQDIALRQRAQSGDPTAMQQIRNPQYLRGIVEETAKVLGKQARTHPNTPQQAPPPAAQRTARPVGAVASPTADAEYSAEQLLAMVERGEFDDADIGDTSALDRALEMASAGSRRR